MICVGVQCISSVSVMALYLVIVCFTYVCDYSDETHDLVSLRLFKCG